MTTSFPLDGSALHCTLGGTRAIELLLYKLLYKLIYAGNISSILAKGAQKSRSSNFLLKPDAENSCCRTRAVRKWYG